MPHRTATGSWTTDKGIILQRGRFHTRLATTSDDVRRAQELRATSFGGSGERDHDAFDLRSKHLMIEEAATGELVCCCRMIEMEGREIGNCYSGQYYDLEALETFDGPMLEIGRFCVDPWRCDPDILRLAWAALTLHVDCRGVKLLFGCTSFYGNDPSHYRDVFAWLRARHLAPTGKAPRRKAKNIYLFENDLTSFSETQDAPRQMPPLLRSYLAMGAWVSDHAVIDLNLNTLHVFTGLEIDAVPLARKRLLRAMV